LSEFSKQLLEPNSKYKQKFHRFVSKKNVEQTKRMREVLSKLRKNESLVIYKFDKGKGGAIMNKLDYDAKILKYLQESGNFEELEGDVLKLSMTEEIRIESKIKEGQKAGLFSLEINNGNGLIPKGTRPGLVYGLPKVYEQGLPLRPIVSFVNTASYALAKWLAKFVKPLANNENTVKDTFGFVDFLKEIELTNEDVVSSFDIENFYPSIPVLEAINLISDEVY